MTKAFFKKARESMKQDGVTVESLLGNPAFEQRRYMLPVYDSLQEKVVLQKGRSQGKSTCIKVKGGE